MKIRIQDHSIRYRITLQELEELRVMGRLDRLTRILGPAGPCGEFHYSLAVDTGLGDSTVDCADRGISLSLSVTDFETLSRPSEEGVYLRREWVDELGGAHRFLAFVEKDRPGSVCDKPEEWIYQERPGMRPETRPIPTGEA